MAKALLSFFYLFLYSLLIKFIVPLKFFYRQKQVEDMGEGLFWEGLQGPA